MVETTIRLRMTIGTNPTQALGELRPRRALHLDRAMEIGRSTPGYDDTHPKDTSGSSMNESGPELQARRGSVPGGDRDASKHSSVAALAIQTTGPGRSRIHGADARARMSDNLGHLGELRRASDDLTAQSPYGGRVLEARRRLRRSGSALTRSSQQSQLCYLYLGISEARATIGERRAPASATA